MKDKSRRMVSEKTDRNQENNLVGYPHYRGKDDIFNKFQQEMEIDPEDTTQIKVAPEKKNKWKKWDLLDDLDGDDLDVPGSELDDDQEEIGNEDEENNYYSLGGDDHNDLDEE